MSKTTPPKVATVKISTAPIVTYQPSYETGEKASYKLGSLSIPVLVHSKQPSGSIVAYTVVGDISSTTFPSGYPREPFVNVLESSLSDRS